MNILQATCIEWMKLSIPSMALVEKLEEDEVVNKVLRTLPKSHSSKVFATEEAQDLYHYSRDQLFGALTTFELREFGQNDLRKETSFKASKIEKDDG